ncbi:phage regulatory protein [Actinobacillus ureae]|uniref:helix-turn-helix transcriptional regulator n=1 Tax=Actinobacillus ureae TaxID=723 RepID=UPI000E1A4FB5|nr:AlpA family phage regulatory protein [Actinobacillus ureae]SUT87249.1 phage regulatory protein [Actinobacillus ureae]SUU48278.1 phage regulatory protein [Actinobacillus ureae]
MELKTIKHIQAVSGFSRAFIYKQVQAGKLSPPIKIGRASRWKSSDVEQWLNDLINNERGLSTLSANSTKAIDKLAGNQV